MASNAISAYLKNLGKSISYAAVDAIKEEMPVTSNFVASNKDAVKDTYKSIIDSRLINNRLGPIKDNTIFKKVKEGVSNLKKDAMSGKFYHPEREDLGSLFEMMSGMMGDDMDLFSDDLNNLSGNESGDNPNLAVTRGDAMVASSMIKVHQASTNAIGKMVAASTENLVRSERTIADQQNMVARQAISLNKAGFNAMAEGFNSIIDFNNKVMRTHIQNSTKFYDEITKLQRDTNATLHALFDMQKKSYDDTNSSVIAKDIEKLNPEELFKNGLNLKSYLGLIKPRIEKSPIGTAYQVISMIPMMMQEYVQNPLHALSKSIIKGVIGSGVRKAMNELDKTIEGAFSTGLAKLHDYGLRNNKTILGKLASMFGYKEKNTTFSGLDASKFHKGPMQYNGLAQKSIVEVIPAYLRRIEAALTGQGERIMDLKSGKWRSIAAVNRHEKNIDKKLSRQSTGNVQKKMHAAANMMNFQSNKDKRQFTNAITDFFQGIYNRGYVDFEDMLSNPRSYAAKGNEGLVNIMIPMLESLSSTGELAGLTSKIASAKASKRKMVQGTSLGSYDNIAAESISGANKGAILPNKLNHTPATDLVSLRDKHRMSLYDYQYEILKRLHEIGGIGGGSAKRGRKAGGKGSSNFDNIIGGYESGEDTIVSPINRNKNRIEEADKDEKHLNNSNTGENPDIPVNQNMMNHIARMLGSSTFRIDNSGNAQISIEQMLKDPKSKATSDMIKSALNATKQAKEEVNSRSASSSMFDFLSPKTPANLIMSAIGFADTAVYDLLFSHKSKGKDGRPINGISGLIESKLNDTFDTINNKFNELKDKFANWLDKSNIGDKLNGLVKNLFGVDVRDKLNKGKQAIRNGARVVGRSLKGAAKAQFNDLYNNVKATISDMKGAVADSDTNATGAKNVTKGGLTFISPGEAIIPANLNPWNPNRDKVNVDQQYRNEQSMKRNLLNKFGSGRNSITMAIPFNAGGTYNTTAQILIENLSNAGLTKEEIESLLKNQNNKSKFKAAWSRLMVKDKNKANKKAINSAISELYKTMFVGHGSEKKDVMAVNRDMIRLAGIVEDNGKVTLGDKVTDEAMQKYGSQEVLESMDTVDLNRRRKAMANLGTKIGSNEQIDQAKFNNREGVITGIRQFANQAFGTDPVRATGLAKDYLMKNKKDVAKGSVGGALLSAVFPLGGPLMGAVVGSAVSLVSKNESVQKYLFGDMVEDENGKKKRSGGLISRKVMDVFNKYAPDAKKYGTTGAIAGLLTPFGPLGGAMIGVGASILKNNSALNSFMFGDDGGLLNKDRKAKIRKALPRMGAAMLGTLFLGPFGLLGNAVLGAGIGLVSTTESFKRLMLGAKGRDGIRRGGIAGAIRRQIVKPFQKTMREIRDNLGDWFKDKILTPIGNGLKPIGKVGLSMTKRGLKSIFNRIGKGVGSTFLGRMVNAGLNKVRQAGGVGKFLTRKLGGGLAEKIASGVEAVGNKVQMYGLRHGYDDFTNAKERVELRRKNGVYDTIGASDVALANMNDSDVIDTSSELSAYRAMTSKDPNSVKAEIDNQKKKELNFFDNDIEKVADNFDDAVIENRIINIGDAMRDLMQSGYSMEDAIKSQRIAKKIANLDKGLNDEQKKRIKELDIEKKLKDAYQKAFKNIGDYNNRLEELKKPGNLDNARNALKEKYGLDGLSDEEFDKLIPALARNAEIETRSRIQAYREKIAKEKAEEKKEEGATPSNAVSEAQQNSGSGSGSGESSEKKDNTETVDATNKVKEAVDTSNENLTKIQLELRALRAVLTGKDVDVSSIQSAQDLKNRLNLADERTQHMADSFGNQYDEAKEEKKYDEEQDQAWKDKKKELEDKGFASAVAANVLDMLIKFGSGAQSALTKANDIAGSAAETIVRHTVGDDAAHAVAKAHYKATNAVKEAAGIKTFNKETFKANDIAKDELDQIRSQMPTGYDKDSVPSFDEYQSWSNIEKATFAIWSSDNAIKKFIAKAPNVYRDSLAEVIYSWRKKKDNKSDSTDLVEEDVAAAGTHAFGSILSGLKTAGKAFFAPVAKANGLSGLFGGDDKKKDSEEEDKPKEEAPVAETQAAESAGAISNAIAAAAMSNQGQASGGNVQGGLKSKNGEQSYVQTEDGMLTYGTSHADGKPMLIHDKNNAEVMSKRAHRLELQERSTAAIERIANKIAAPAKKGAVKAKGGLLDLLKDLANFPKTLLNSLIPGIGSGLYAVMGLVGGKLLSLAKSAGSKLLGYIGKTLGIKKLAQFGEKGMEEAAGKAAGEAAKEAAEKGAAGAAEKGAAGAAEKSGIKGAIGTVTKYLSKLGTKGKLLAAAVAAFVGKKGYDAISGDDKDQKDIDPELDPTSTRHPMQKNDNADDNYSGANGKNGGNTKEPKEGSTLASLAGYFGGSLLGKKLIKKHPVLGAIIGGTIGGTVGNSVTGGDTTVGGVAGDLVTNTVLTKLFNRKSIANVDTADAGTKVANSKTYLKDAGSRILSKLGTKGKIAAAALGGLAAIYGGKKVLSSNDTAKNDNVTDNYSGANSGKQSGAKPRVVKKEDLTQEQWDYVNKFPPAMRAQAAAAIANNNGNTGDNASDIPSSTNDNTQEPEPKEGSALATFGGYLGGSWIGKKLLKKHPAIGAILGATAGGTIGNAATGGDTTVGSVAGDLATNTAFQAAPKAFKYAKDYYKDYKFAKFANKTTGENKPTSYYRKLFGHKTMGDYVDKAKNFGSTIKDYGGKAINGAKSFGSSIAEYGGKAVNGIKSFGSAATEVGAKGLDNAVYYGGKAADAAKDVAGKGAEVVATVKDKLASIADKLSTVIPSDKMKGVKAFFSKIIEYVSNPKNLAKGLAKLGKQGVAAAAGAGSLGIGYVVMTAGFAIKDFYDGYTDAAEILGAKDESKVTTGMKIVSGIVHAITGAIPIIGPFLPADELTKMAIDFLGPVFGFSMKDLQDTGGEDKDKDKSNNESEDNKGNFIEDATKVGVGGALLNKLGIGKAAKGAVSSIGSAVKTGAKYGLAGVAAAGVFGVGALLGSKVAEAATPDKGSNDKVVAQALSGHMTVAITEVARAIQSYIPESAYTALVGAFASNLSDEVSNSSKFENKIKEMSSNDQDGDVVAKLTSMKADPSAASSAYITGSNSSAELFDLPAGTATEPVKILGGIISAVMSGIPFVTQFLSDKEIIGVALTNIGPAIGLDQQTLDKLKKSSKAVVKQSENKAKKNDFTPGGDSFSKQLLASSKSMFSTVLNTAGGVASNIVDKAKSLADAAASGASSAMSWVAKQAGSAWDTIKNVASSGANAIANAASSAWDKAKSFGNATLNGVKGAASWVANKASSIGSGIADAASSAVNGVKNFFGFGGSRYGRGEELEDLQDTQGYKIPEYNKIKDDDSLIVKKAKHEAQMKGMAEWRKANGTDSGNVVGTDATNFYSQLDPRFDMPFNSSSDTINQSMRDSGCGPVSAVNALSSLGINSNPMDAASYALNGYKETDGGTLPGFFKSYLNKNGADTKNLYNPNSIKDSLRQGNPVILMGQDDHGENGSNPYGENPHYVTATGLDNNGNIIVQDPESYTPNKVYKANDVLSKSSIAIGAKRHDESSSASPEHRNSTVSNIKERISNILSKYSHSGRSRYGRGAWDPNKMWALANWCSQHCSIPAELLFAQWYHESGAFASALAVEDCNFGGMTQVSPEGSAGKQPDGGFYYMHFDSPEQWAEYYSGYMHKEDKPPMCDGSITTVEQFGNALKSNGYFGADLGEYKRAMQSALSHIPSGQPDMSLIDQSKFGKYDPGTGKQVGMNGKSSNGNSKGNNASLQISEYNASTIMNNKITPWNPIKPITNSSGKVSAFGMGKNGKSSKYTHPPIGGMSKFGKSRLANVIRSGRSKVKHAFGMGSRAISSRLASSFGSSRVVNRVSNAFGISRYGRGAASCEDMWNYCTTTMGMSNQAAAALLGSVQQESSFDPTAIQDGGNSDDVPDAAINNGEGVTGYGICQWTGSRAKALKDFAQSQGKKAGDWQLQLEFFKKEATERGDWDKLLAAQDLSSALKVMKDFEGYGEVGHREEYAQKIFQNQGKGINNGSSGGNNGQAPQNNSFFGALSSAAQAIMSAISPWNSASVDGGNNKGTTPSSPSTKVNGKYTPSGQGEGQFDMNVVTSNGPESQTNLTNVRGDVKAATNDFAKDYMNRHGKKLMITGGAETYVHANGPWGHHYGWKLDVDDDLNDEDIKELHDMGVAVNYEDPPHYDLDFSGHDTRDKALGSVRGISSAANSGTGRSKYGLGKAIIGNALKSTFGKSISTLSKKASNALSKAKFGRGKSIFNFGKGNWIEDIKQKALETTGVNVDNPDYQEEAWKYTNDAENDDSDDSSDSDSSSNDDANSSSEEETKESKQESKPKSGSNAISNASGATQQSGGKFGWIVDMAKKVSAPIAKLTSGMMSGITSMLGNNKALNSITQDLFGISAAQFFGTQAAQSGNNGGSVSPGSGKGASTNGSGSNPDTISASNPGVGQAIAANAKKYTEADSTYYSNKRPPDGPGGGADCSGSAWWCVNNAGVTDFPCSDATVEFNWLKEKGLTFNSGKAIQSGDLMFTSKGGTDPDSIDHVCVVMDSDGNVMNLGSDTHKQQTGGSSAYITTADKVASWHGTVVGYGRPAAAGSGSSGSGRSKYGMGKSTNSFTEELDNTKSLKQVPRPIGEDFPQKEPEFANINDASDVVSKYGKGGISDFFKKAKNFYSKAKGYYDKFKDYKKKYGNIFHHKKNKKDDIPILTTVSVDDIPDQKRASNAISENTTANTNKPEKLAREVAPNGEHYTENDILYLTNHGYTRENAIDLLSKDPKYTNKMEKGVKGYADEVGPNGEHYSNNDIKYLTNNGYTREDAIKLLSTSDKYAKNSNAISEEKNKKELPKDFSPVQYDANGNIISKDYTPSSDITITSLDTKSEADKKQTAQVWSRLASRYKESNSDKDLQATISKNLNAVNQARKNKKSKSNAISSITAKYNPNTETQETGPNGRHYQLNDIKYLMNNGYTREAAIQLLSKDEHYTDKKYTNMATDQRPLTEEEKAAIKADEERKKAEFFAKNDSYNSGIAGSDISTDVNARVSEDMAKDSTTVDPFANRRNKRKRNFIDKGLFWLQDKLGVDLGMKNEDFAPTKSEEIAYKKQLEAEKAKIKPSNSISALNATESNQKVETKSSIPAIQPRNTDGMKYDDLGNIVADGFTIPEYNKITKDDDITVTRAKKAAQKKAYDEWKSKQQTSNSIAAVQKDSNNGINKTPDIINIEPKKNEIKYDDLGNIVVDGFEIPEYNKITKDDDLTVVKAKKAAQKKAYDKWKAEQDKKKKDTDTKKPSNSIKEQQESTGKDKRNALFQEVADTIKDAFGVDITDITGNKKQKKDEKTTSIAASSVDTNASSATVTKDGTIKYDDLGNIVEDGFTIPEYNKITKDDDLTVVKAKKAAQRKAYDEWKASKPEEKKPTNSISDKDASKKVAETGKKATELQNSKYIGFADEVAPNGEHYTNNDIGYLVDHGYTREAAIDLLSKDPKYASKKKAEEAKKESADSTNNTPTNSGTAAAATETRTLANPTDKIDTLIEEQKKTNELLSGIFQFMQSAMSNYSKAQASTEEPKRNVNTGTKENATTTSVRASLSAAGGGSKNGIGDLSGVANRDPSDIFNIIRAMNYTVDR